MKNLKMMLMASLLVIGENIIALDASYFAQAGKCMFQKELSLVSKSLGAVNGGSLGLVSGATVGIARGAFLGGINGAKLGITYGTTIGAIGGIPVGVMAGMIYGNKLSQAVNDISGIPVGGCMACAVGGCAAGVLVGSVGCGAVGAIAGVPVGALGGMFNGAFNGTFNGIIIGSAIADSVVRAINIEDVEVAPYVGENGEAVLWSTLAIGTCTGALVGGSSLLNKPLDLTTSSIACTSLYAAFVAAIAAQ